jgi:hypothetical protein
LASAAITADAGGTIKYLRVVDQKIPYRGSSKERVSFRGKREDNAQDFKALRNQINDLRGFLRKMSSPALILLFSGEDDVKSDDEPPEVAQQKTLQRLESFTVTLDYLQMRCDFLLAERPGEHGNADYRQRRVAQEAWRLLKRHGTEPAGGTGDSLFGEIASLLWEGMTGEYGKDLQWACKAALTAAKAGELRDNGSVIGKGRIPLS